jgi:N utilization substance protein A
VQQVRFDEEGEEEGTAIVIVPDHQLSLAIGREGQNARLAARLSGYRIDIRSESQDLGLDVDEDEEAVEFETVEEGDGATHVSADGEPTAVSDQDSEEQGEQASGEDEAVEQSDGDAESSEVDQEDTEDSEAEADS